jgi:hypothetical protein
MGALRPGDDSARRVLAAPVRSGETLTDARFLSPDLLSTGPAGLVAYPLRIEDADIAGLLRVGDRIDLYAATSSAADSAGRVAQAVRVLALPGGRASPSAAGSAGALVVIAASSEVIGQIAQSAANSRITIALTPDRGG